MSEITQIHTGAIIDDDLPLVPSGEYHLSFIGYRTCVMFGRQPKLILEFEIAGDEVLAGTVLKKYYNVRKLRGRKGRNGNFVVSRTSNFIRDFFRVCPTHYPKRLDRIPLSRLKGLDILGKIETVTRGFDQKEIPEPLQYSVIREIYR